MSELNVFLDATLDKPYTDLARQLMITKQAAKPLHEISRIIKGDHSGPAYRLYSAHDTNIANWLEVLLIPYTEILFADNIFLEVYLDEDSSYKVVTLHNGKVVFLKGCNGMVYCDA